jgi:hypothetical protein
LSKIQNTRKKGGGTRPTDRENPEHKKKQAESPTPEIRQGWGTLTSKQRPGHPSSRTPSGEVRINIAAKSD